MLSEGHQKKAVLHEQNLPLAEKGKQSSLVLNDGAQNPPISFCWENITIRAREKNKESTIRKLVRTGLAIDKAESEAKLGKVLLDRVTGCVKPGEVVAIMGASGAGKTTLLNSLTFRNLSDVEVMVLYFYIIQSSYICSIQLKGDIWQKICQWSGSVSRFHYIYISICAAR